MANILGPGDVPLQDTQPPLPDQGLFLQVIPGFRLVTAQELFSKCIYLGFEIPQEQVSICFGFLSATAFLKVSNQVCGMHASKYIDNGKVAT